MAGAIAGTAILRAPQQTEQIHTIALTVNNRCSLACPHCYLQYDGPSGDIAPEVVDAVLSTPFQHLAIVGKEPFVDSTSIKLVESIIGRARDAGKSVSVITNGLSLAAVPDAILRQLAYLDVSLDGGPISYRKYRHGSLAKLQTSLKRASRLVELNALHVLSSATLPNIDDMCSLDEIAPFRRVMFSPYLVTSNHGRNSVDPVSLPALLSSLAQSFRFRSHQNTFLLVDGLHLQASRQSADAVLTLAHTLGILDKVTVIPSDPITKGFLRVNYDGLVLSPLNSLSPTYYATCGSHVSHDSLESAFARFRAA